MVIIALPSAERSNGLTPVATVVQERLPVRSETSACPATPGVELGSVRLYGDAIVDGAIKPT